MRLIGETVLHKTLGKGIILSEEHGLLTIQFAEGEKRFRYPDAFAEFMVFAREALTLQAATDLARQTAERQTRETPPSRETSPPRQTRPARRVRQASREEETRQNIVFSCAYCDGGASESQFGFNGVCSDASITHNIKVAKDPWCRNSLCSLYHNGELSREELVSIYREDGSLCYESMMLRDWTASAKYFQGGYRAGDAIQFSSGGKNQLAVLTTRLPGSPEAQRVIFAVFLIDMFFSGERSAPGCVANTASPYRLSLTPEEAKSLLYWEFHANKADPATPKWGSGLYRFIADREAALIVKRILEVKQRPEEKRLAADFLKHFCALTHLDITSLGEPQGALQRK